MSAATAGRYREYQARDDLISRGYPFIGRFAASKGPADLLHGHPLIGALLVQVGNGNKTLGPADRNRFMEAAALCHATPLLATVIATPGKRTGITYWRVTHDVPATWDQWHPGPKESPSE